MMPSRRAPYTKVEKKNQVREPHVKGMGDVEFKGFQCINPRCTNFIFVKEQDITEGFSVSCSECGMVHEDGEFEEFYEYDLVEICKTTKETLQTIDSGSFEVSHRAHILSAPSFKYCIVCNCIKPLEHFDNHKSRKTKRQGECRSCKKVYNAIKNPTRTPDQHREAAQKRRLYVEVSGKSSKLDQKEIFRRFDGKCFKCNENLCDEQGKPIDGKYQIDHTLPAYYLFPLTTDNATLLCSKDNGKKSGKWPSEFYNRVELGKLSAKTGIDQRKLEGKPFINPDAINFLSKKDNVVELISKYARYRKEIVNLRNRLLENAGHDIFDVAGEAISGDWRKEADA